MDGWKHSLAVSATLALGLAAAPGWATGGRPGFQMATYGVEVEVFDSDGTLFDWGPMEVLFYHNSCCIYGVSTEKRRHEAADVWSPWVTGRFEPTSLPPDEGTWPCVGGIGHCSAFNQTWDEMEMADGQLLYAHVAALPENLGRWSFNRHGRYDLKPGDASEFRFRLNTDRGPLTGEGRVLWMANRVPEPATWVMLVAGFGLLGASLRRRGERVQVQPSN